jgi:hypothetical protein
MWTHTLTLTKLDQRLWWGPLLIAMLKYNKGRFTHTMLFPCRSACVFSIWFTQWGRVWFTHTMPFPCHATNMPFWQRPLKATARSRQGNGMGKAWYVWISIGRPETAYGRPAHVRLLPATTRSSRKLVIGSIPISDAGGQCETKQRLSLTRRSFILVQGHKCLYNLQHKDCDKNLVIDNYWKEITGEFRAQYKEVSRRTQHCRRMAGSRLGNGMVCVNRPLRIHKVLSFRSNAHRSAYVSVFGYPVICFFKNTNGTYGDNHVIGSRCWMSFRWRKDNNSW